MLSRPFGAIIRIRAVEVNGDPDVLPFGRLFPIQGAYEVGLDLGAILFKKMEVRLAINSARVQFCANSFFGADDNISKVDLALPDGIGHPWLWLRFSVAGIRTDLLVESFTEPAPVFAPYPFQWREFGFVVRPRGPRSGPRQAVRSR
ncbi:MAG: hypothetical protein OXI87_09470 [Albidovulum sp.]|nr:hypothetical protein [Albidovulum sp.]